MDIIGILLSAGKALFGLREKLATARQGRKQAVADFIATIGQTMEDVSAALRQGIYPAGKCAEMKLHSENIVTAIGDLVGHDEAVKLAGQLNEVWQIEQLYGELGNKSQEAELSLQKLDEAAGLFRATAAFVRVSQ
jgi:hypothetical protein